MIRISLAVASVLALSACGGGGQRLTGGSGFFGAPPPAVMFATGPIYKACLGAGRKTASRARCGCVQAVADRELSNADARRGVKLWNDPSQIQEIRQSDNTSNERFWKVWKAYGNTSAKLCKGT